MSGNARPPYSQRHTRGLTLSFSGTTSDRKCGSTARTYAGSVGGGRRPWKGNPRTLPNEKKKKEKQNEKRRSQNSENETGNQLMIRRTRSINDTTPMVLRTSQDNRRGRVRGAWAGHVDSVVQRASFRRYTNNARMPAIPRTTRCPRGLAATSSGFGHHMTAKEHGHDDHKPKRSHPWIKRNSTRDRRTSRQASSKSHLAQGPAAGPGSKAIVPRLRDSSAGNRRLGTTCFRSHQRPAGVSVQFAVTEGGIAWIASFRALTVSKWSVVDTSREVLS